MRCKVIVAPVRQGEEALQTFLDHVEGLGGTVRLVSSAIWGGDGPADLVYTVLYEDPMLVEGTDRTKRMLA